MDKTQTAIALLISKDSIKRHPDFNTTLSKIILNDLKRLMGDHIKMEEVEETKPHIVEVLNDIVFLLSHGQIESRHAKAILNDAWETESFDWDTGWYLCDSQLLVEADSNELDVIIIETLKKNPKVVKDITNGKKKAAGSLIGPIMKALEGKGNPREISQRIIELSETLS